MAASRDKAAIRDPFISPAHLTKPERWPLPEGSIYEGVGVFRHAAFFIIRSPWHDPEILLYCYKSTSRKVRRMLKALAPSFALICQPVQKISPKKTGPRKSETDST